MSDRKLFAVFGVLLLGAGGLAAWAFLSHREVQRELAEREQRAQERAALKEQQGPVPPAIPLIADDEPEPEPLPTALDDPLRLLELPAFTGSVTRGLAEAITGRAMVGTVALPTKPAALDDAIRAKLLGAPPPKPEGQPNQADSTRARTLRWTLRLKTRDGSDYLAQLKALGAEILVPLPPDGQTSLLFPDLSNLKVRRAPTDADLKRLAGKVQFSDARRQSVEGVAGALGVNGRPKTFAAYFPKDLEAELARKETGYRNRRPEDIEETIFRVTIRGGRYEIVVDEQTPRK